MSDRPTLRDPPGLNSPEDTISEIMISAGEEVLLAELGGVEVFWSPRDLAISVYQAMREASRT